MAGKEREGEVQEEEDESGLCRLKTRGTREEVVVFRGVLLHRVDLYAVAIATQG